MNSRRVLQIGGLISGGVLIAFGIVVIVLAINGRNTVHDELMQQQITGTPDMTPAAIKAEGAKPGLQNVTYPTWASTRRSRTLRSRSWLLGAAPATASTR